jgi:hypothetical protein
MTKADWWARVIQARTEHDDLLLSACGRCAGTGTRPRSDLRAVAGIGAELVLTVDGELRRTREAKD